MRGNTKIIIIGILGGIFLIVALPVGVLFLIFGGIYYLTSEAKKRKKEEEEASAAPDQDDIVDNLDGQDEPEDAVESPKPPKAKKKVRPNAKKQFEDKKYRKLQEEFK